MPAPQPPYWMAVARKYIGVHEVPGPQSHPTIAQWFRNLGGVAASLFKEDSQTPWCAVFCNRVLEESGLPLSGRPGSVELLRAKSFLTYGTPIEIPAYGALAVFERAGGGHVGFVVGQTLHAYRILSGNQNDSVNETWINQKRCVALRWPDPNVSVGSRVWLRPDAELFSTDET